MLWQLHVSLPHTTQRLDEGGAHIAVAVVVVGAGTRALTVFDLSAVSDWLPWWEVFVVRVERTRLPP